MNTPPLPLSTPEPPPPPPPRHPWQVTVAACFMLVCVLVLLYQLFAGLHVALILMYARLGSIAWGSIIYPTILAALIAVTLISAIGLFRCRPWARRLALIVLVLVLLSFTFACVERAIHIWHIAKDMGMMSPLTVRGEWADLFHLLILRTLVRFIAGLFLTAFPFVLLLTRPARAAFLPMPRNGGLPPSPQMSEL